MTMLGFINNSKATDTMTEPRALFDPLQ